MRLKIDLTLCTAFIWAVITIGWGFLHINEEGPALYYYALILPHLAGFYALEYFILMRRHWNFLTFLDFETNQEALDDN